MRTRFAPSPTGYLHVGGARTALFCYLQARAANGVFILRIEDTDLERSTAESVQAILDGMAWLGLDYDEGPFYQTHRFDRYSEVVQRLLDEGKAYHCWCSKERIEELREGQMKQGLKPRYDGHCRDGAEPVDGVRPVVRFRNPPDGDVVFEAADAFVYDWRVWSLPELADAAHEAGFASHAVYVHLANDPEGRQGRRPGENGDSAHLRGPAAKAPAPESA